MQSSARLKCARKSLLSVNKNGESLLPIIHTTMPPFSTLRILVWASSFSCKRRPRVRRSRVSRKSARGVTSHEVVLEPSLRKMAFCSAQKVQCLLSYFFVTRFARAYSDTDHGRSGVPSKSALNEFTAPGSGGGQLIPVTLHAGLIPGGWMIPIT